MYFEAINDLLSKVYFHLQIHTTETRTRKQLIFKNKPAWIEFNPVVFVKEILFNTDLRHSRSFFVVVLYWF